MSLWPGTSLCVKIATTPGTYSFTLQVSDGSLRTIFRSQVLYRATSAVAPGTLLVTLPDYATGDEVCCPAAHTERRYVWDAKARKLRRQTQTQV